MGHEVHVEAVPKLGRDQRGEHYLKLLVSEPTEIEAQVREGRDPREASAHVGIHREHLPTE